MLSLYSKSFIFLPSSPSCKWEPTEQLSTGRSRLALLPVRRKAVSKMGSALKEYAKDYTKNAIMLQAAEKWQEVAFWKS